MLYTFQIPSEGKYNVTERSVNNFEKCCSFSFLYHLVSSQAAQYFPTTHPFAYCHPQKQNQPYPVEKASEKIHFESRNYLDSHSKSCLSDPFLSVDFLAPNLREIPFLPDQCLYAN